MSGEAINQSEDRKTGHAQRLARGTRHALLTSCVFDKIASINDRLILRRFLSFILDFRLRPVSLSQPWQRVLNIL